MDRQIIVLTADKRQEKLLGFLKGKNEAVADDWDKTPTVPCERLYVLPIPMTKLDKNQGIKDKLKEELINASNHGLIKPKVFGGVVSREWELFFKEYQIPYWDFMKLPEVVEGNAWITAEATLAEVLELSAWSIREQKILVTGYGCCGEKIAKLFAAIGAQVVVVARREEVRNQAREDGCIAIRFEDLKQYLPQMDTVINTVPAMVLSDSCIKVMSSEALIVDIASSPGGTDFEATKSYGIKAKLALGLPGIYTTSSSAKLLYDAICKYAPLEENNRGDKVWIFQVII